MKCDRWEKAGLWIFGIGLTLWLVCAVIGLMVLLGGCRSSVPAREPADTRAQGWCVQGRLQSSERVEACTEKHRTCRTVRKLARTYGAPKLRQVGRCRQERQ